MAAAIELVIIPTLLILAIVVLTSSFSVTGFLVSFGVGALLLATVVLLLRKGKQWDGPREDHEQRGHNQTHA